MRNEWVTYQQHLTALSGLYSCGLMTDIVAFFPTISTNRLVDFIADKAGSSRVVTRLSQMLESWNKVNSRGGLPMRANASNVLASMYLQPIDDLLTAHGLDMRGGAFFSHWRRLARGTASRWVDDMWLFGDDRGKLRAAQLDLESAFRGIALHMNLAKTDVLEGEELISKARQLEHSAVEVALDRDPRNWQPMDELIDIICTRPEHANPTSVRFVTVRLRKLRNFARVDDFLSIADRMPQAAGALARLFRDSGHYRDLYAWYQDYLESDWSRITLAAAQFGTMFPSAETPPGRFLQFLSDHVRSTNDLPMLAWSVQRLAAWNGDLAREVIRDLATRADEPHSRRVLALAALNAGIGRAWVRDLLAEFRENAVTLDLLAERNFQPISPGSDFVGN